MVLVVVLAVVPVVVLLVTTFTFADLTITEMGETYESGYFADARGPECTLEKWYDHGAVSRKETRGERQ